MNAGRVLKTLRPGDTNRWAVYFKENIMKKFHYEIQLSKDWCFEINIKKRWGFGFLVAPAAIHFRVWRLWFSLVHEGYLYAIDDLIKIRH